MEGHAAKALIENGALGATLFLILTFIGWFIFKYYLPSQHEVQKDKARLDAENTASRDKHNAENMANRDKFHQQQVEKLMDLLQDNNKRFDQQIDTIRKEHAKAYDLQREFFRSEMANYRAHTESTVNQVCEAVKSLHMSVNQNSLLIIAFAESQGFSKPQLLGRVKDLGGGDGLEEQYKTGGDWNVRAQ